MVSNLLSTQQWRNQMKWLEGEDFDEITLFFDHFAVILDEIDRLRERGAELEQELSRVNDLLNDYGVMVEP